MSDLIEGGLAGIYTSRRKNPDSENQDSDVTASDDDQRFRPRQVLVDRANLDHDFAQIPVNVIIPGKETLAPKRGVQNAASNLSGPMIYGEVDTLLEAIQAQEFSDGAVHPIAGTITDGRLTITTYANSTPFTRPDFGTEVKLTLQDNTVRTARMISAIKTDATSTTYNQFDLIVDGEPLTGTTAVTGIAFIQARNGLNKEIVHDMEEYQRNTQNSDGTWNVTKRRVEGVKYSEVRISFDPGQPVNFAFTGQGIGGSIEKIQNQPENQETTLGGKARVVYPLNEPMVGPQNSDGLYVGLVG